MEGNSLTADSSEHNLKKQIKRPARLDLTTMGSHRHKWEECKVYGKNILIRSYAGACIIDTNFYVYGGLQIFNGILSDFHRLNLGTAEKALEWEIVPVNSDSVLPGPRAKHGLVAFENKIFLVGGIKSLTETSNQIFVYDTLKSEWKQITPKGCQLPPLQSFGCVLINKDHPTILIICGYNKEMCKSTNSIYSYDIHQNQLQCIFNHTSQVGNYPCPRTGCGATFDGKHEVYIFGGKCEEQQERLNDLWKFNLDNRKFTKIVEEEGVPLARSGHSLNYYNQKLFLFGGIHDITWELDDLHIFDIKHGQWIVLEIDSARKKKESSPLNPTNKKNAGDRSAKDSHHQSPQRKKSTQISPHLYMKKIPTKNESSEVVSPTKTINELKHKAFLQKKADMLRNFDVKEEDKESILNMESSSQAMKNSLDLIGNGLIPPDSPVKFKKRDFGKTTHSRFMEPLEVTTHFIPGRKPCARDGHNAVLLGNKLIVFGGDRHHMSFNDMYVLHIDSVVHEISKG